MRISSAAEASAVPSQTPEMIAERKEILEEIYELLDEDETGQFASEVEAQLKQRIQERMGDATRAIFETGEVTWKRSKDSTVLDVSALTADHPDLTQAYVKAKPGSRRFLVVA